MNYLFPSICATSFALFLSPCQADTIRVCQDGSCAYSNIQLAIGAANGGDVIQVSSGTYSIDTPLTPGGKVVTVRGSVNPDGTPGTRILGLNQGCIRCVNQESSFTVFENLVLTGTAQAGGGAYLLESSPAFVNCCFDGCLALNGGAVYCSRGSPYFVGCVFQGNSGVQAGGAAHFAVTGVPQFVDCRFSNNVAGVGGALWLHAAARLTSCVLSFNRAASGGGVAVQAYIVSMTSCAIYGNEAIARGPETGMGGGIYASDYGGGRVALEHSMICGNVAPIDAQVWPITAQIDLGGNCINDNCGKCMLPDADGDGVPDQSDNCPSVSNASQADCNFDGIGDACVIASGSSSDYDGNGVPDSCQCLADLFVDHQVNGADLGILLSQWGAGGGAVADINRDGHVNGADLGILLSSWGACP